MMAWLAMMVATVARTTSGMTVPLGASLKNGLPVSEGVLDQQCGLAGVAQQECGQDDPIPGRADRRAAEVSHVSVERFTAGDCQEDTAEYDEALPTVTRQKAQRLERIDRGHDDRLADDTEQAEYCNGGEPEQHDRPKDAADTGGAARLDEEQAEQYCQGRRQHVGLERVGDDVDALQRTQHRDCWCNDAVAVDQGRAEQAHDDEQPTTVHAAGDKGHECQGAALAMIVGPHDEHAVFDRYRDNERPDDER